jgi:hypothetical protein
MEYLNTFEIDLLVKFKYRITKMLIACKSKMRKKLVATGIVLALAIAPAARGVTATLPAGTKASLAFMVEEEKLARDVYATLYAKTGLNQFKNINKAEQTHMDLMRGLLKTYGIKDPTIGKAVGKFNNASLAALYKKLIADGSVSLVAAIDGGIAVEKKDIADTDKILQTKQPDDVKYVLDRLLAGSYNHLAAFTR